MSCRRPEPAHALQGNRSSGGSTDYDAQKQTINLVSKKTLEKVSFRGLTTGTLVMPRDYRPFYLRGPFGIFLKRCVPLKTYKRGKD